MTRRVEIIPLESGYLVKGFAQTEAEAFALQSALVNVPKASAFVPALDKGPAFDSPERVVSGFGSGVNGTPIKPGDVFEFFEDREGNRAFPPNCDGFSGYAEPTAGEVLAQAQHIAAEGDDGCTSTVCAMTRGSGD